MLNQVRYLPIGSGSASPLSRKVYAQIRQDFGMVVDPFRLHASLPTLLAGVWAACRETELVGVAPRSAKELVAACVSETNRCPYCVDAHTMLLNSAGQHTLSKTFVASGANEIADDAHRRIAEWALASRTPDHPILSDPPFKEAWRPELIGMVVFYNYLNRMVHLFLPEHLLPVRQKGIKQMMKRLAGWYFSSTVNRARKAGHALEFLPLAELPEDLQWTLPNKTLAQGFAQMATVIDELAAEHVPAPVQEALSQFLTDWRGEDAPLNPVWMNGYREYLPESQHSMLDLCLLLAAASYRLTDEHVVRFQQDHSEPTVLLATAAWASFRTSRRIGGWLVAPNTPHPQNLSAHEEHNHAH